MSNKRYIEIKHPLPLKDQETAITRMRGERWRIDTSEPAYARYLQRKGHVPVGDDDVGHYLHFDLPANAQMTRSLFALENSRQVENLPNGSTGGAGSTPKPPKVGEKSTAEREIEDEDDSSVDLSETEPRKGPKSSKGEANTKDRSETSARSMDPHADGDSS